MTRSHSGYLLPVSQVACLGRGRKKGQQLALCPETRFQPNENSLLPNSRYVYVEGFVFFSLSLFFLIPEACNKQTINKKMSKL